MQITETMCLINKTEAIKELNAECMKMGFCKNYDCLNCPITLAILCIKKCIQEEKEKEQRDEIIKQLRKNNKGEKS